MNNSEKPKKSIGKIIIIAIAIILVIGIIGSLNNKASQPASKESSSQETSKGTEEKALEPTKIAEATTAPTPTTEAAAKAYETKLSAGYYTSGVDFPSGKYDLTAVSGYGNVYTQDGDLNEVMSTENDGLSIEDFKNAKLEEGQVLVINGNLVLNINSDKANVADIQPRANDLTKTVELSSGNYVAGEDFPAGTYDIVATDGYGNVYTDDGELNEVLASSPDDTSVDQFKNYEFAEGIQLSVSDVSVKLVPSK